MIHHDKIRPLEKVPRDRVCAATGSRLSRVLNHISNSYTMAGKRKKSGQRGPNGPKEFNEKDAKIGNISTFEDVADSEDEFHIQRDKVMLDDGPQAKRQRKYAEEGTFTAAARS